MKKIYLACFSTGWDSGDVMGYALTEDGHCIARHISRNKLFSQHDMGFTSNLNSDTYEKYCGPEYELEWVDNPDSHDGWWEASRLNKKLWADAKDVP